MSDQELLTKKLVDIDSLMEALHSPDVTTRREAVTKICPCRMGWETFEKCFNQVVELQKDPNPSVRQAASHVIHEAFEMKSSGHRTTRQEVTNPMAALKRQHGWQKEEDEAARRKDEKSFRRGDKRAYRRSR